VIVQNRSPVPLTHIQVTPVLVDGAGRVTQQSSPVVFNVVLQPGLRTAAPSRVASLAQAELPYLRLRVDSAKVAE